MCSITAQRSSAEPPAPREHPTPGLASATMGGKQTWGDELVFHGWRIQRSALTDRCRLLDENDRRVRSGTFDECRQDLERIKRERELPPLGKKAVVLLHGLMRSRDSMVPLGDYLGKHGYEVVYVGYPSTRASVGDHARALAKVVRNLDGVEEINFVAHSLGNLVVRHYLYDETDPATGRHPDARIHRFVEIGPPNQQPGRARWWDQNDNLRGLFHVVAGASGRELGDDWAALEPHLATPACEFGILAGGKGDERGFDQSIPGDDDGTLAVFETRLTGARDFLLVPVLHTFLPEDRRVQRYTLNFLQHGCFTSENERRPIVARRVMIER